MANYNMGRYYAWSNLTRTVRSLLKRYSSQSYQYHYIPPKITTRHISIPYEQWYGVKTRNKSINNLILVSIGFLSFIASKFVFEVLYDNQIGYRHHTRYPILTRSIELIHKDVLTITDPFFEIVPKNRIQVGLIFPKLYELVTNKQKKIEEHDRKAMEFRKEIEQYDKKHNKI